MSQRVLRVQVKTDCGKEGSTYLDLDYITKDPGLLLPNVQQIGYDLLPGASEIHASYLDGDGDRCTLSEQTAKDALYFAVGVGDETVLEVQVQDRSTANKEKPGTSCAQLKAQLAEAKKAAVEAEAATANASKQAEERFLAELKDLKSETKRKSEEIARLTALCDSLQAEVVAARKNAMPISDNSEKLSASVSECAPLILGIEAYEDVARRGCVGQNLQEMVDRLGCSQAESLGCMIISTLADDKKTQDSIPACAKFTVINNGSVPWPETTAVVNVKGENYGTPIVHLGQKGPGEAEEIVMDLLVPPNAGSSEACSVWSVVNAATGTPLGPVVILEVEWRSQ